MINSCLSIIRFDQCNDVKSMTEIKISTDKKLLNINYIHSFLTMSYWAKGIPKNLVEKSINNSFCFGIYKNENQIGFARVITDFTVFAYLADVFIDESEQSKGYGRQLLQRIFSHKELKGLRRWHLLTGDAQKLYEKFGFSSPENPIRHMEKTEMTEYALEQ